MLGLDFTSSMYWILLFFFVGFEKLDTENPQMVGFHKEYNYYLQDIILVLKHLCWALGLVSWM